MSQYYKLSDPEAFIAKYLRDGRQRVEDKEQIVAQYKRLIIQFAKPYQRYADLDDLIQAGMYGLLKALERFDPNKGYKFSTYADSYIKKEMRLCISATWEIRLPNDIQQLVFHVTKAAELLEVKLGRAPSAVEIAAAAKVTHKQVNDAIAYRRLHNTVSINAPHYTDSEEIRLNTTISDNTAVTAALIMDAIKVLPMSQQEAMRMVVLNEITIEEAAQHLDVSRQTISNYLLAGKKAIRNLVREAMRTEAIRTKNVLQP